jgi:protein-S-isoprenylcysteine O-methyltransferase Ste14
MRKPFTFIAVLVFALIAIVHVLRLVFGWEVTLNAAVVPMWVSVIGLLIAGALAVALWWESRQ